MSKQYAIKVTIPSIHKAGWYYHDTFTDLQVINWSSKLWRDTKRGETVCVGTRYPLRTARARVKNARLLAANDWMERPRVQIWELDHHSNPLKTVPLRRPSKPHRRRNQKPSR